jgi:ABC-type oligopeptide transport system substrate-binding subunit
VVLQQRRRGRQVRSRSGQEDARGSRRQGSVDEGLGDAGAASLHAQRPPRRRTDPGDFAKVGVKVEIVSYEWGEYLTSRWKPRIRDGAVILGWTGDNGDPDNFLTVCCCAAAPSAATNRAFWCNEEFDDLCDQAKATSDIAERTKLYEEAQVIFKDQAPWATLGPLDPICADVARRSRAS